MATGSKPTTGLGPSSAYTTNEVNPAQVGRFTPSGNIPNTTHIININQAGVGFYLHQEGPNLGKNIVSIVSCYNPPRRTVRDLLSEIRRF